MAIWGTLFKLVSSPLARTAAKTALKVVPNLLPKKLGNTVSDINESIFGTTDDKNIQLKRDKLKYEVQEAATQALGDIALAETTQGNWLQRSWRPLTMMSFVVLICINAVLPLFKPEVTLNIPEGMWNLLTIGMTTYIGARTIEKFKK